MSIAAGTALGGALVVASPASAAPGDAAAVGISADVAVPSIAGVVGLTTDVSAGDVAVTGSGTDGFDADGSTLVQAAAADIGADAVTTSVSSTAARSTASSAVAGASVGLFGLDVLTADAATATATCPVGGTPTSAAELTGLTLLGQAVTLDADTPTRSVSTALTGDLAGVTLTVDLTRTATTTGTTATATAVRAVVSLDGTVGGVTLTDDTVATVVLAQAECDTPTAGVVVSATGITPGTGPTAGGQTVTITGTGFAADTGVTFGGVPATDVTVAADGNSLTAVTPAGAAGTTTAVVTSGGTSDSLPYVYVAPTVTRLAPATGPTTGGTAVTITGTGLQVADEVRFGGTRADVQSVSDDGTTLVVTAPAGTGLVDVTVGFPGDTTITAPTQFRYVTPVPTAATTVTGVSPAVGPAAGGQTVVISGTGLAGTTAVTLGGVPATIIGTPTDTSVTVTTPAGTVGTVDVAVTGPDGTTVADDAYRYLPVPAVTGSTPGSGPVTGGTTVTVSGDAFVPGGTTVTICGVTIDPSDVTVSEDGTQLRFTAPACAAGAARIAVTTAGGTSNEAAFRYLPVGDVTGTVGNGVGTTGSLAFTGNDPRPGVAAAAVLLLLGAATALVGHRRRRSA